MSGNCNRAPRFCARLIASLLAGGAVVFAGAAHATSYGQTNLVTDDQTVLASLGYAPAAHTDPNLVNPWGISHSASSPFWVSDNGTGLSTVYNGGGSLLLTHTVPPAGSAPTGQVFNPTAANFGGANFIFATEGGTIAARIGSATTATLEVTTQGAVYKGLAIGNVGPDSFLYAANFSSGMIDVFNSSYAPVNTFSFADPNLPAGYAPFNVQTLGGNLYVSYALQDAAKKDDVAGAGNGFVDEYSLDGILLHHIALQGFLNSPWGVDIAPVGFGEFAGDLLVGNFGDGTINAYDPNGDNAYLGTLKDGLGNPIVIDGLWGLINGNGGNNGNPNFVYFAAGINDEENGLFGSLSPMPEAASIALLAAGLAGLAGISTRRRRQGGRPGMKGGRA